MNEFLKNQLQLLNSIPSLSSLFNDNSILDLRKQMDLFNKSMLGHDAINDYKNYTNIFDQAKEIRDRMNGSLNNETVMNISRLDDIVRESSQLGSLLTENVYPLINDFPLGMISKMASEMISPMLAAQNIFKDAFEKLRTSPTFSEIVSKSYSFNEISQFLEEFSFSDENKDFFNERDKIFKDLEPLNTPKYDINSKISENVDRIISNNKEASTLNFEIWNIRDLSFQEKIVLVRFLKGILIYIFLCYPTQFEEVCSVVWSILCSANLSGLLNSRTIYKKIERLIF